MREAEVPVRLNAVAFSSEKGRTLNAAHHPILIRVEKRTEYLGSTGETLGRVLVV
ncbi:hypothetical protein LGT36_008560 [Demequina sp. TMPB413]|nr:MULTISPECIES: hypothetical protein [unclassified Demequina]UPU87327.1 hypothetical protein LGT36_008560 [Demequina sp. TMPB413]